MFDFYGYHHLEKLAAMEFADSYFYEKAKGSSAEIDMDEELYNSGSSSCYCNRIFTDNDSDMDKLRTVTQGFWIATESGQSEKIESNMCY